MATQNNIRLPDNLLADLRAKAEAEGKTVDEIAEEAIKRYVAREWIDRIELEGQSRRKQHGLKSDEEIDQAVEQAIAAYRHGR